MFEIGDWVVYKENWPHYRANKVGIVREVIGSTRFPQEDWYIRVEYIDPKLANSGIEQMNAFRLHLGDGDLSPWDTESILDVPYGDDYNLSVEFYWNRRVDELCQNWKNDPCWDLEKTEDFEWAYDKLLQFRLESEAAWKAEREVEIQKKALEMGIPNNLPLAAYILRLEDRIKDLSYQLDSITQSQ